MQRPFINCSFPTPPHHSGQNPHCLSCFYLSTNTPPPSPTSRVYHHNRAKGSFQRSRTQLPPHPPGQNTLSFTVFLSTPRALTDKTHHQSATSRGTKLAKKTILLSPPSNTREGGTSPSSALLPPPPIFTPPHPALLSSLCRPALSFSLSLSLAAPALSCPPPPHIYPRHHLNKKMRRPLRTPPPPTHYPSLALLRHTGVTDAPSLSLSNYTERSLPASLTRDHTSLLFLAEALSIEGTKVVDWRQQKGDVSLEKGTWSRAVLLPCSWRLPPHPPPLPHTLSPPPPPPFLLSSCFILLTYTSCRIPLCRGLQRCVFAPSPPPPEYTA